MTQTTASRLISLTFTVIVALTTWAAISMGGWIMWAWFLNLAIWVVYQAFAIWWLDRDAESLGRALCFLTLFWLIMPCTRLDFGKLQKVWEEATERLEDKNFKGNLLTLQLLGMGMFPLALTKLWK